MELTVTDEYVNGLRIAVDGAGRRYYITGINVDGSYSVVPANTVSPVSLGVMGIVGIGLIVFGLLAGKKR